MPFSIIETWSNGEQSSTWEPSWPKVIAHLQDYDFKDKQRIVLLTIAKVEK